MNPEQMMEKIRHFVDGYNNFDVDAMLEVLDPEVVFINTVGTVTNVEIRGIDAFRQLAEQSLPVFSSRKQNITESGEVNGGMEVKIEYEAILAQDLGGLKAGETVKLQGLSVYLFNEDRISFIEDIT